VFRPAASPVNADSTAPVTTVASPTQDAVVPAASPVWIKGRVTDDRRIGTVEVAVQDRDSLKWWNAKLATWQTGRVWSLAGIVANGPYSGQWSFGLVGVERGERYTATVRAFDSSGNVSAPVAGRRFTVAP
jgi:hypothetical protein